MSDTFSADSKVSAGAISAPGAGVTLAAVTGLQSGAKYKVVIRTGMAGTIDTGNPQNIVLKSGGAPVLANLPSVSMGFPIVFDQLSVPGTDLTLSAIGAFGAASIVAASITATRVG